MKLKGLRAMSDLMDQLAAGQPVVTDSGLTITPIPPTCGYCRDCKWWSLPVFETGKYGGLGRCEIVHAIDELTEEQIPEYLSFGQGYDDSGSLLTKPDFGCVQFEGKP